MTGRDQEETAAVLSTPGIPELIAATTQAARAFLAGPSAGPLNIAVGCVGGRHRGRTSVRTGGRSWAVALRRAGVSPS
ncbi:hypothetical protein [Streptomyces sp. KMM 9044]|uniref:hypothetical protein n=1 Tax=Streptomyces sp. KMM 9044 TaxID=2744474 RepID=UPI003FA6E32B